MQAIALLLIFSATVPDAEIVAAVKTSNPEPLDLFTAPTLPDWPEVLESREIPDAGRCFTLEGEELADGTYLPRRTAETVEERLDLLERYPLMCQRRLDGARLLVDLERERAPPPPLKWQPLEVATVVLAGFALGIIAGYLAND